ncbi:MAG TPA: S41 family peptidase [Anaerolineales bacterium]|nr:S41 family peptidase [Anaerolineales bacterium]
MVIDPATQGEILDQLIQIIRSNYVYPQLAEKICIHMEQTQKGGEYQELTEGDLFALGLTLQLQEASHDEHLWVRYHAESIPKGEAALRFNQIWQEQQKSNAKRENFGFYKLDNLPGNVAYVDLRYLHRVEWVRDKIANIMQSIAACRAAIIDLRKCTGGYPDTVCLLCSYLFEEKPVHLLSIYWRDVDKTQEYWTNPQFVGLQFFKKPLFLLTSCETFSAAEALAEILQSHKRAIIVGEKTDGGSHPGASFFLHEHFEAFIPIGLSINPLTGKDWEGDGIKPDILAPAPHSFNLAYRLALEEILSRLDADVPQEFQLADEIHTALKELE